MKLTVKQKMGSRC